MAGAGGLQPPNAQSKVQSSDKWTPNRWLARPDCTSLTRWSPRNRLRNARKVGSWHKEIAVVLLCEFTDNHVLLLLLRSRRLKQRVDRQLTGVKLTLPGKCRISAGGIHQRASGENPYQRAVSVPQSPGEKLPRHPGVAPPLKRCLLIRLAGK